MEDPRIRALAVFLIQNAVELQAGENILIELHGNASALAKALIQESYKRGAHPYFQRFDYELEAEIARGADEEHMSAIAAYEIERMKNMNAYIDIRDYDNIYVWSGLPEKQTSMYAQRYWGPLHLRQRCNHTKWSVLRYPNPSMAQLAGMDTPSYEDFYFRACLCDYRKMEAALKPLKALMDRTDRVQILGKGTDISFSIKGIGSYPMHGNRNIPDGEIYSAPVRNSVNGVVSYNVPSTYEGTLFTDVVLTFENGKITDAVCNDSPRLNRISRHRRGSALYRRIRTRRQPGHYQAVQRYFVRRKNRRELSSYPGQLLREHRQRQQVRSSLGSRSNSDTAVRRRNGSFRRRRYSKRRSLRAGNAPRTEPGPLARFRFRRGRTVGSDAGSDERTYPLQGEACPSKCSIYSLENRRSLFFIWSREKAHIVQVERFRRVRLSVLR